MSTYFSLPNDNATTTVTVPKNTTQLILGLFASGNAEEEFWYTNLPNEYNATFYKNWNITFLGEGSFREVAVWLDDEVVGVAWPFEVVFTGGINPGFWQPVVGHRTFDLPSYQVDLTPFLDKLAGKERRIRFTMAGQPETLQNWFVSGHLQVRCAKHGHRGDVSTQPDLDEYKVSPRANVSVSGRVSKDNSSFTVVTKATRHGGKYTLDYTNQQSNRLLHNATVAIQNISQSTYFTTPFSTGHFLLALDSKEVDHGNKTATFSITLSQTFYRCTTDIHGYKTEEHAEVRTSGRIHFGKHNKNRADANTSVSLSVKSPGREYVRSVKASRYKILSDYEVDRSVSHIWPYDEEDRR